MLRGEGKYSAPGAEAILYESQGHGAGAASKTTFLNLPTNGEDTSAWTANCRNQRTRSPVPFIENDDPLEITTQLINAPAAGDLIIRVFQRGNLRAKMYPVAYFAAIEKWQSYFGKI